MGKISEAGRAISAVALLAALFALAIPASAQQQSWRPASRAGERQAFIDTSSIRRDGDRVRFVREIRGGEISQLQSGERFNVIGAVMEVDCRARTLRNLELYIRLDEAMVGRAEANGNVEPVQPGSTADTDLRAACFNEWPAS